jgi:hypothetical protein
VLLEDSTRFLQQFRRVQSSGKYPLPLRWQRAERRELLELARENGRLYGKSAGGCVAFGDKGVVKDRQCPAYYASVVLRDAEEADWIIELVGRRTQKKRPPASSSENRDGAELVRVPISLPVMPQLKQRWQMIYSAAEDPLRDELESMGLRRVERRGAMWTAKVDAAAATGLAAERLLSPNVELEVRLDREIEFAIPLELVPSEKGSQQAFARDRVVRQILAASPADMITAANGGRDVTLAAVRCRLWQLGLYGTVYQLRQDEDFQP